MAKLFLHHESSKQGTVKLEVLEYLTQQRRFLLRTRFGYTTGLSMLVDTK